MTQDSVGHGNQKVCSVLETRILVEIGTQEETGEGSIFRAEIPVGQYSDYQVFPTCGISTTKKMIGEVDDPRYFAHPDRAEAGILWLSKGYVEYLVPNILPAGQKIDELTFTMEISSEAPGFNNDWPSDITFLLNDTPVECGHLRRLWGQARAVYTKLVVFRMESVRTVKNACYRSERDIY